MAAADVARLIAREASLTSELAEREAQLREVEEARDQARREHQSAVSDVARLSERAAAEREGAAACQTDLESRINALREESDRLDREHRAERERLEAARSALDDSLDRSAREHARVLATCENEIEQLRTALKARVEELHQSRADNHRLFQHAPLPMFRCSKDGVLTHANRMLAILLGRRSAEELRSAGLAAATFESPNELSWLIERCLDSKGRESIETTWRRKDGSRLLVRLSACATSSDLIECGVEDLTPIRLLHDRLGQAHRMEAVGRVATEVAVTCGSLLESVHQNAQQLVTDGIDTASRDRGETLLEEVSGAAGLLRQLAAYGEEESRKPAVVELRTVVRNVAPVLQHVVGDGVEVQLPAAAAPLNVDAGSERVKRLLVNLAAAGHERMPFGGRLKIELGTIVVDRSQASRRPPGSPRSGNGDGIEPAGNMIVKIRLPPATVYGDATATDIGPSRSCANPRKLVPALTSAYDFGEDSVFVLPSSYHGTRWPEHHGLNSCLAGSLK